MYLLASLIGLFFLAVTPSLILAGVYIVGKNKLNGSLLIGFGIYLGASIFSTFSAKLRSRGQISKEDPNS